MTTAGLTEPQAVSALVLLAKAVAVRHWPNDHGRCPHCGEANCLPYRIARQALRRHSRPPAPILAGDP